jgi:hypothetical protein
LIAEVMRIELKPTKKYTDGLTYLPGNFKEELP